ncbi:hypothetical protein D3C81_1934990 [compost metagenome]
MLLSSFWNGGLISTIISAAASTMEAIIHPLPPLEEGEEGGVLPPTLFITGTVSVTPACAGTSAEL